MSLKQKLQEDLKSSMKNKDNTKKSVVTLMCSPTTSPYGYSSFQKEENRDTTDFSVNPYLRVSQALYENKKL